MIILTYQYYDDSMHITTGPPIADLNCLSDLLRWLKSEGFSNFRLKVADNGPLIMYATTPDEIMRRPGDVGQGSVMFGLRMEIQGRCESRRNSTRRLISTMTVVFGDSVEATLWANCYNDQNTQFIAHRVNELGRQVADQFLLDYRERVPKVIRK